MNKLEKFKTALLILIFIVVSIMVGISLLGQSLEETFKNIEKPVIYLYPLEDVQVRVELDIDGENTKTIPPYGGGWYVLAKTDGTIIDESQGERYDYLFWEAKLNEFEFPDTGWVVAQGDLKEWFNEYLPKLGLNKKEKEQFMEYWLEQLQGSDYYELKLLSYAFLEEHAKLTITPAPDTIIRVIFHFTPLNEYRTLDAPEIETPKREGFVVLEWGGILSTQNHNRSGS